MTESERGALVFANTIGSRVGLDESPPSLRVRHAAVLEWRNGRSGEPLSAHSASPQWAAIFSIAYVVSRLLYAVAYLADVHMLRSSIWSVGFASTIALMILPVVS